MNQDKELNDNLPETETAAHGSPMADSSLSSPEQPASAVAQIVNDISTSPDEILKDAFPAVSAGAEETVSSAPKFNSDPPPSPSETGMYQLDNAMVDKLYRTQIDLEFLKIEGADLNPKFGQEIAKLGLSIKRQGNFLQIEGLPSSEAQGEHKLFLDYTYDGKRIHRKIFNLLINPDPKSLWKNIEPAAELPYRKDHTATRQITSQNFKIIAASRRGRSHAHEGKFREDDFAVSVTESDWHIMIVADGAGSAKLSRQGSFLACQTAHLSLEKSISELIEPKIAGLVKEYIKTKDEIREKEIKSLLYQVLCGAAFASYKKLERESEETGNPLKDYSTTLLISIVKKFTEGTFIAAFGIGDGAVGVFSEKDNKVELMISPDGGEFSGQTRFLTMREVIGDGNEMLRRVKFNIFERFSFLGLMTDGIADPKFGTDNNLVAPEKWNELGMELIEKVDFDMRNEKAAEQLLDYMDFWTPGEHDDRTLAILY